MSTLTFDPVENVSGVLAIDFLGRNDCAGIVNISNDATNTSGSFVITGGRSAPLRELDSTLKLAFNRYDDLLRRLAD